MRLRLEELRRVASSAVRDERVNERIRAELFRVLGPPVMVPGRLEEVAKVADEQLDLLEGTGRPVPREEFRLSVLNEAATNSSPVVRKLAARLLPFKTATRMLDDSVSAVRCAAARRLPHSVIREASRRHPHDDQLHEVVRTKRIQEASARHERMAVDVPFDEYGREVEKVTAQERDADLPDTWYNRLAHQLCSHYGTNLEGHWEETLATRVAASHYATSGVKLDREKLLKAIHDCIQEREESVLGEGSLRSIAKRLIRESREESPVMPVIDTPMDPVRDLLESDLSSSEYLSMADRLFNVAKSYVPAGIKKYVIGEGNMGEVRIPMKGTAPGQLTSVTERALDLYVEHWNRQQALVGEPYRLSWTPHPMHPRGIGFNVTLK